MTDPLPGPSNPYPRPHPPPPRPRALTAFAARLFGAVTTATGVAIALTAIPALEWETPSTIYALVALALIPMWWAGSTRHPRSAA